MRKLCQSLSPVTSLTSISLEEELNIILTNFLLSLTTSYVFTLLSMTPPCPLVVYCSLYNAAHSEGKLEHLSREKAELKWTIRSFTSGVRIFSAVWIVRSSTFIKSFSCQSTFMGTRFVHENCTPRNHESVSYTRHSQSQHPQNLLLRCPK